MHKARLMHFRAMVMSLCYGSIGQTIDEALFSNPSLLPLKYDESCVHVTPDRLSIAEDEFCLEVRILPRFSNFDVLSLHTVH